jgi:hypothetical protein
MASQTNFQQAALIPGAEFVGAVLVAQVDFHSCDLLAEPVQGAPNSGFDLLGQRVVAFNVAVGVNLYLHFVYPPLLLMPVFWQ